MNDVLLKDIMCEHPITVKEDVTVGTVAHLLLRYRINGILVVSKDDAQKLIGVFTTTDLLHLLDEACASNEGKQHILKCFAKESVGQRACKQIVSLQARETVAQAISVMHERNVHTIPIFDNDKIVGVIGRHDVLNIALSDT